MLRLTLAVGCMLNQPFRPSGVVRSVLETVPREEQLKVLLLEATNEGGFADVDGGRLEAVPGVRSVRGRHVQSAHAPVARGMS